MKDQKETVVKDIIRELFDIRTNGGTIIGGAFTGKDDPVRKAIRKTLTPILVKFPEEFLVEDKQKIKSAIINFGITDVPNGSDSLGQMMKEVFFRSSHYQPGIFPPLIPSELLREDDSVKRFSTVLTEEAAKELLEQKESGQDLNEESAFKKAYKKLALAFHPDKNNGSQEATENFQAVQSANELLESLGEYRHESVLYAMNRLETERLDNLQKESSKIVSEISSDLVVVSDQQNSPASNNSKTNKKPTSRFFAR